MWSKWGDPVINGGRESPGVVNVMMISHVLSSCSHKDPDTARSCVPAAVLESTTCIYGRARGLWGDGTQWAVWPELVGFKRGLCLSGSLCPPVPKPQSPVYERRLESEGPCHAAISALAVHSPRCPWASCFSARGSGR